MNNPVKIRHPELDSSDTVVSRDAYEMAWAEKGWTLVEDEGPNNADVSASAPVSGQTGPRPPRKVTDNPQA